MTEILQFEDFAADAESVRQSVISGEFSTQQGPDGAMYTGISAFQVPHWKDRIAELIGKRIKCGISCFRLNLKGELPHSWVHSDGICAQYASVLYMNEPKQCKGGTAFWRHRVLNIDRLPLGEDGDFYRQMDSDWKDLSLWEALFIVPMAWNRFITYPTSLFHSRFPFEGFGTGPQDGRLIWICFYDIEEAS